MAKSDSLFLLVKSLSAAEKRYIKLFSKSTNSNTNKKYIQLLDAFIKLSDEDTYDETKLIKAIRSKIKAKNLSYEKNYLYQFILKSLRNFHADSTPRIKLQELITDCYLLYEKGLLKETMQSLKKAKKIAETYDYDLYHLDISLLERRIIRQFRRKNTRTTITTIQQHSQKKLDRINRQLQLLNSYEDIFIEAKNYGAGKVMNEDLDIKIQRILPIRIDAIDASFEIKMYYHLTHSMYHYINRDWKERAVHLKAVLDYFSQNPFLLNDLLYQERYLNFLNNYINYCYAHGTDAELLEQIQVLEKWKTKSPKMKIQIQQYRLYGRMLYAFKRKQFSEMVTMAPQLEQLLEKYKSNITLNRRLTFLFHLAAAHLLEDNFGEALIKVNQIINQPKFEARTDIQMLARIMRIIIFIEEGNTDIAEYEILAAGRYQKKSRKNNLTEKQILSLLRKLIFATKDQLILKEIYDFLKFKSGYEELYYWIAKKVK